MEVREITAPEIEELSAFTDPDIAELIGRTGYTGLQVRDSFSDEFLAGMIWEMRKNTIKIRWIRSLTPEAGDLIFEEYAKRASETGTEKTIVEIPMGDQAVEELLLNEGFDLELNESEGLYIPLRELGSLKDSKLKGGNDVKPIIALSTELFEKSLKEAVEQSRKILSPDLEDQPMYYFDMDISCAAFTSDGQLRGMLLMHETASGNIRAELLFAKKPDAGRLILDLIDYTIKAAEKIYPPDTLIHVRRTYAEVRAITDRLMPDASGRDVVRGERMEG